VLACCMCSGLKHWGTMWCCLQAWSARCDLLPQRTTTERHLLPGYSVVLSCDGAPMCFPTVLGTMQCLHVMECQCVAPVQCGASTFMQCNV
jgi:hypothetical protein